MVTIDPADIMLGVRPINFNDPPRTESEIEQQEKEYIEQQNTYIKPKYECDELNKSKYENPIEEKIRQSYCELKIRCLGPLDKIKNKINYIILILITLIIVLIVWNVVLTTKLQTNTKNINILVEKLPTSTR
jgi:hypothetical protein